MFGQVFTHIPITIKFASYQCLYNFFICLAKKVAAFVIAVFHLFGLGGFLKFL